MTDQNMFIKTQKPENQKRFMVIACEILFREVCLCAARSRHIIDPLFLPKGLHDMGEKKMKDRLQQAIDEVDCSRYDAILLVYGLCNHGVRGLSAGLPLVIPRAHDCITLLLGSRQAYQDYFEQKPGTYFKSSGWIERDSGQAGEGESITDQLGMNRTYQEYVEAYGEENAAYLMETLGDWLHQYRRLAYIDTGTGDIASDLERTREEAARRDWEFEALQGDTRLIMDLLDGQWSPEEFQVIEPGNQIVPSFDERIIGQKQPEVDGCSAG